MTHNAAWLRQIDIQVAGAIGEKPPEGWTELVSGIHAHAWIESDLKHGIVIQRQGEWPPRYTKSWDEAMGAAIRYAALTNTEFSILVRGSFYFDARIMWAQSLYTRAQYELKAKPINENGPLAICLVILEAAGKDVPQP